MTIHAVRVCVCGCEECLHAANRGPCQKCVGPKACQRFRPRKKTESLVRAFIGHAELANLDNPVGKEQELALRALHAAIDRVLTAFGAPSARKRKVPRELPEILSGPPIVIAPRDIKPQKPENGAWTPGRCERELLRVLSARTRTSNSQLAVLSGYSVTSGGFSAALAALRAHGLIEGDASGLWVNAEGREFAPVAAPQASPLEIWRSKLGKCERVLLDALCAYPNGLTRDELAEATGYSATSGGFSAALAKLRTLELAEGSHPIVPSQALAATWGQT